MFCILGTSKKDKIISFELKKSCPLSPALTQDTDLVLLAFKFAKITATFCQALSHLAELVIASVLAHPRATLACLNSSNHFRECSVESLLKFAGVSPSF